MLTIRMTQSFIECKIKVNIPIRVRTLLAFFLGVGYLLFGFLEFLSDRSLLVCWLEVFDGTFCTLLSRC